MNTSEVNGNRYTKLVLRRIRSKVDRGDDDFRDMHLYVSPTIAQWAARPRLKITDYSKLEPCCPGRREEHPKL